MYDKNPFRQVQESAKSYKFARAHRLAAKKAGSTPNASVEKKQYSWGRMVVVHDGSNDSFPLHPEHQHLLKQLKHNDSDTFVDETGRTVTAMRHGDHIHLSGSRSNKKLSFHRDELNEARRYGSAGPVQDHMAKKPYPKLVRSAEHHPSTSKMFGESLLLEKEQDAKMKAQGYKLVGRTATRDPNKEKKDTTYSVYSKGNKRLIIRTRDGKEVHEGFFKNQMRLKNDRKKREEKQPTKLKPLPNPREDD